MKRCYLVMFDGSITMILSDWRTAYSAFVDLVHYLGGDKKDAFLDVFGVHWSYVDSSDHVVHTAGILMDCSVVSSALAVM